MPCSQLSWPKSRHHCSESRPSAKPSAPKRPSCTAVTTLPSKPSPPRPKPERTVLEALQNRFPELRFVASKRFCWSPESQEIFYDTAREGDDFTWSLLHETGHALLGHTTYLADFEL